MAVDIRVPALGESVTEATIGKWLKAEGDTVKADEPLVELETDKVSVEVPAPSAGVLSSIRAKEGDTVEVDALIGAISEGANSKASKPAAKAEKAAKPETKKAETKKAQADKSDAKETKKPAKAPAPDAGGDTVEIRVPSSGESVTEADIGEWLVEVGDTVKTDDPLVTLETDKASMDVPAPASGVIKSIAAKAGATIEVGALLGVIAVGEGASARAERKDAPEKAETKQAETPKAAAEAMPAARRVIAENKLDASNIEGTGRDGRITKGDALAYLEQAGEEAAETKPAGAKPARELGVREERVKMTRLRQTIATRLKQAQSNAAMLTTFNDVDMSAVMETRAQYKALFEKKHGAKLGFMSFFVKACVHALRELPDVNAEIDGTDIIYKDHYDIGIAVGTERGLVVPVVRDADEKSMAEIEKEIADYGKRARDGALKLEEMQGGTFSLTNGGIYGSLMSTPILNAPQSAILGMHRIEERPVVRDGAVVVRPMMYLALSYDHRIVDGKGAVTFLVRVKENLEDPQRLLLDL